MSDSHDNMETIKKAVKYFNEIKVKAVLHAGDIVSPFTVRAFQELEPKLYIVFGNNDGDRLVLSKWFEEMGAEVCGDFADLTIDGLHIALLHGTNEALVKALAESGNFDVVVRGHTHEPGVKLVGSTHVINPGECAGVLSGKATVAVLEIGNLNTEITTLD